MKKILILSAFCIAIGFAIFSCSKQDENLEIIQKIDNEKQKTPLNKETSNFKTDIISILDEQKTHTKGDKNFKFTEDQIRYLTKQSLKMFNSHGFRPSEFKEFLGEGDDRIILMATMFVGILESESINTSIPRVKSGLEGGEDDSTCWDTEQILGCVLTAVTGLKDLSYQSFVDAFNFAKCLTKKGAKTALVTVLKKVPIGTAILFIPSFTNCMGWTDFMSDWL